MKILFFGLLACLAWAAEPADAIRGVLDRQVADWNRGDIQAFMAGYDETVVFVGKDVTRSRAGVLESYRRRYPTRERMGTLRFAELEITPLSAEVATVIGRWHLTRSEEAGGAAGGIFSLVLRKRGPVWRIVLDHTTAW